MSTLSEFPLCFNVISAVNMSCLPHPSKSKIKCEYLGSHHLAKPPGREVCPEALVLDHGGFCAVPRQHCARPGGWVLPFSQLLQPPHLRLGEVLAHLVYSLGFSESRIFLGRFDNTHTTLTHLPNLCFHCCRARR